jgi:transporter family-2 protein
VKSIIIVGVVGALATGLAIGMQASLSSRTGTLIGPIQTGLLTNLIGGALAGLLVLALILVRGVDGWQIPKIATVMLFFAGTLGIFIITGVSFSLSRIGITAGLATIILGQMVISVIVDSTGWGGVEPIPMSYQRIAGLVVMGIAVFLLLPRQ